MRDLWDCTLFPVRVSELVSLAGLHVGDKFRDKRADYDIVGMGVIRPVDHEPRHRRGPTTAPCWT